jgi:DNA-directed RNA polymerase subunit RPC12/RpoP
MILHKDITHWRTKKNFKGLEERFRKAHGEKYDYSKAIYKSATDNVLIICPTHGEFNQSPMNHSLGRGCSECGFKKLAKDRSFTIKEFISKAKKTHGNFYDYSEVEYNNTRTKITIICPKHGKFHPTAGNHLGGSGCPDCGNKLIGDKLRMTTLEFIERANEIHKHKYNYSKISYIDYNTRVNVICPIHGNFEAHPGRHLHGSECRLCANENIRKSKVTKFNEFIERASDTHNDKYDYSKVKYKNSHDLIYITCPEHGEFKQMMGNHLAGSGCPKCGFDASAIAKRLHEDVIIKRFIETHKLKYDYSKVKYQYATEPVSIICPEHGMFSQLPVNHYGGQGCPDCASYGFNDSIPGQFYVLKFLDYNVIKVGITNVGIEGRYKTKERKLFYVILFESFKVGSKARELERFVLNKFKKYKYQEEKILEVGFTELLSSEVLKLPEWELVIKKIKYSKN